MKIKFDKQYINLIQIINALEFGEWCFYPVKDKTNLRKMFDDVVRNTSLKRNDGLSEKFVAIAENGMGDFLCVRSGELEIYHQNHEEDESTIIFSNLKEFINYESNN